MNLASYKITINPLGIAGSQAQLRYKSQVTEHLRWIHRTISGKILLDAIKFHGRDVEIQPFTGTGCNALGGWNRSGGVLSGIVYYTPGVFSSHSGTCGKYRAQGNRGMLFDEVLYHELFHVFRGVSGKWKKTALSGHLSNYTDTEEFFAVLVTNIYLSDKSNKIKTGLRASHATAHPLGTSFAEPWGFFARGRDVFGLVDQLYQENRGLFLKLANDVANAEFNPLTDYLVDKDKARRASEQADSIVGTTKIILELLKTAPT